MILKKGVSLSNEQKLCKTVSFSVVITENYQITFTHVDQQALVTDIYWHLAVDIKHY